MWRWNPHLFEGFVQWLGLFDCFGIEDRGSIPLPFTMKNLDVNIMYQHDTEKSPALKYCQPGLLIDLRNFLKLLNKD